MRNNQILGAVTAVSLFMLSATSAHAVIIYNVDYSIGTGGVAGTITTDGSFGVLSAGNFIAWTLVVTGLGAADTLTNLNSGVFTGGTDITADTNHIYFDFTHDDANPSYLLFQKFFSSGQDYVCASNATYPLTPCFEGTSAIPRSFDDGTATFGHPTSNEIIATAGAIPEPATWAMMLAGFGAVGFAMRRRQKVAVSFA